jgi:hypothetical protein
LRVLTATVIAWPFSLWFIARHRPPWSDEAHFLDTVRQFGSGMSVELLRSYNELSAPLTYIVYAAWGDLVGFEVASLRFLSPMLAAATLLCYSGLLERHGFTPRAIAIVLLVIAINPYFVGTSIFVYTDMLALLGMVLAWLGVETKRWWLAGIGISVATLTRQYSAFLAAASVISAVLASGESRRDRVTLVAVAVLAMMPLVGLVVLWGGALSPVNHLREMYLSEGLRFDPHALSLYLAAPAIYLAPLTVSTLRSAGRREWLSAAIPVLWLAAFPVQASSAQLRDGIATVGFAHRAFLLVGEAWLAHAAFLTAAAVSVVAIATWLNAARVKERRELGPLFPWVALVCFLLLMPFSFQPWEKYALPELMIGAFLFGTFHDQRSRQHRYVR